MGFSVEMDGMYVFHWALHVCCNAAVKCNESGAMLIYEGLDV